MAHGNRARRCSDESNESRQSIQDGVDQNGSEDAEQGESASPRARRRGYFLD